MPPNANTSFWPKLHSYLLFTIAIINRLIISDKWRITFKGERHCTFIIIWNTVILHFLVHTFVGQLWLHDKREVVEGRIEMLNCTRSNGGSALDKAWLHDLRNDTMLRDICTLYLFSRLTSLCFICLAARSGYHCIIHCPKLNYHRL